MGASLKCVRDAVADLHVNGLPRHSDNCYHVEVDLEAHAAIVAGVGFCDIHTWIRDKGSECLVMFTAHGAAKLVCALPCGGRGLACRCLECSYARALARQQQRDDLFAEFGL